MAKALEQTGECWAVSIPGADRQLRLEILAHSVLPDVLAEQYKIYKGGSGTRIVSNAIEAQIHDKHGNITRRTIHAGEVPVTIYYLELPE